jgi:hypothetical protein
MAAFTVMMIIFQKTVVSVVTRIDSQVATYVSENHSASSGLKYVLVCSGIRLVIYAGCEEGG